MTTPKLYELTNEYRVLLDVLEANDESPEAFAAAIDDLKGQIEDKQKVLYMSTRNLRSVAMP